MITRRLRRLKNLKPTPRTILKLLRLAGIGLALFILLMFGGFLVYANDLPDPNKINSRVVSESSKIYDRNDTLLYEIHGEVKRTLISFDEMPKSVKEATIALEDKNFYEHRGIDFQGILRAAFRDVTKGRLEGGSSITQQLVKNALLSREKTFTRKFKELVLTVQIERRLSKEDILKLYLNEIPYGQNAYGVEAAAQTYFGKSAQEITLAESAYLAALPQRPSYLNPWGTHKDVLDARKNFALDRMAELGYISRDEAENAKKEEVTFVSVKTGIKAPHFIMYVQELLEEQYGKAALEEGGFKIVTSLDYELQKMAEEAVAENKDKYENYGATNAGLVAIDPNSGEILAMVGSSDFFNEENQGQVNIAIRDRQPGSSFKPYVYAAAFENGYAPASKLMDIKTVFGTVNGEPYAPQNYTGDEYGPVSMRKALAGSLNISAVKTLYLVGVKEAINTAKKLGIESNLSADVCGLSLVLGGCEIKLLDHTAAFSVFANGGKKYETKAILKIEDKDGEMVFEQKPEEGEQVISEEVSYLITDIMSDNASRAFIFGPSNYLTLSDRPVAAKTGTTQNWRDAWTVGYTPDLAVGVWVGNMNGKLMKPKADGSVVAAPIWNAFLKKALRDKPAAEFKRPDTIIDVEVDKLSGLLPTEASGEIIMEKFSSSNLPRGYDNVHQRLAVNKSNGLLATENTPPDLIEYRTYTVLHSERPEDPDWENPVRTWAEQHSGLGYSYPPTQKDGGGDIIDISIKTPGDDGTSQDEDLRLLEPKSGHTLNGQTVIKIGVDPIIDTNNIRVYLRDSQGFSLRLVGEIIMEDMGGETIYQLYWTPTPDLPEGSYTIFASLPNGIKSNLVNVYLP